MIALVISPYRGDQPGMLELNKAYLNVAIRDAVIRGYSPVATHKMFTESLNDNDPTERILGMQQRDTFMRVSEGGWVNTDLEVSNGMKEDIEALKKRGIPVDYVYLYGEKKNAQSAP